MDDATYERETPSARLRQVLQCGLHDVNTTGTLPASIFNDPEVHAVERERVFGRAWIFLAHESELPEKGDYAIRYISEDQFIVCRDQDGEIKAHLNACRHHGMQVCRAEMGNSSHFRCPYHGWTYSNRGTLVGVPAGREAYGNKLEKSDWNLQSIPHLDTYKGLIFGSLDPNVVPLSEYLGDMTFYLDIILDRSDAGMEVVGAPQRWIVDANWKLGADNFVGDAYHTMMTHRSMVELGLAPRDPKFALYGEHIRMKHGHGLGVIGPPPEIEMPEFMGLPTNIIESLQRRLTPEQVTVFRPAAFIHGTVFPNLSFGNFMFSKDHLSPPTPYVTLRIWHPIEAGKMEVWSFLLVEKDAPEEFKTETYKSYVRTFGSSGVFEQDDAENWRSITHAVRGQFAKQLKLNYQMGRGLYEPDRDWPGPGEALPMDYAEANQRNLFEYWMQLMSADQTLSTTDSVGGNGALSRSRSFLQPSVEV